MQKGSWLPKLFSSNAYPANTLKFYFKNKDKKYLESNKVVQKIAKDFSGYPYFGAKSLIVMAKNYFQLNDSYQATSILTSVIENFTDYQDVIDEATSELEIIKAEEAKTNSSIIK